MLNEVYSLYDEDDVNGAELSHLERDIQHARDTGYRPPVVDLTRSEEEEGELLEYENRIIINLEDDGVENSTSYRRSTLPFGNPHIPNRLRLTSCRHSSILIKPGTLVEVSQRPRDEYKWQFLHITELYKDPRSGGVILRGIRLTRHRYMRGLLPRMKNEVCALYDIDQSDARPEDAQAAVEISETEVIRTRAFSRTNDAFPSHRFNPAQWKTAEEIEDKGNLVQRWKFFRYWPTSSAMATKKSYSGAVVQLRSADITDKYCRVADNKLRNEFRGGIVRGGLKASYGDNY